MTPGSPLQSVELPQGTVRYRDSGSGQTIVFLHGLLMAGSLWEGVIARLDDRYRCIAPDLPLGAHSPALNHSADTSPPGIARLVANLLEALDLDAVTLVGNDTGGAIAQLLATRHPDRIGRLVLTNCDAYQNFLPPLFRYLQVAARLPGATDLALQSMRIRPLRWTPLAFGLLSKGRLDGALVDSWLRPAMQDAGVRRDARKLLRGIHASDTVRAARELRTFDRPTLIAWAPEDRVFTVRYGERLAAEIPGARFERIEDSLTLTPIDQPERTATLIADFVDGDGDAG
jgi:pimeloyl-ACP methyl ester carboxylesterase